ncbi:hypothetical protein Y032_0263g596 [Ancylostoma ceylanicum]|uniref:Uncharacterized protein n=1 Tax=Ancylostoma ceylanicum TaxID=53326 RepID=A0A016SAI6_9BILA|nr:hypothetical protein Y032_0263g596 [Ancylostoma ceylanicum]
MCGLPIQQTSRIQREENQAFSMDSYIHAKKAQTVLLTSSLLKQNERIGDGCWTGCDRTTVFRKFHVNEAPLPGATRLESEVVRVKLQTASWIGTIAAARWGTLAVCCPPRPMTL